jgi:hypothetical protein
MPYHRRTINPKHLSGGLHNVVNTTNSVNTNYSADGVISDLGKHIKKGAHKAVKFAKEKAPKIIKSAVTGGLDTLLKTGSLTAAVTNMVREGAREGVAISKEEAEKYLCKEYNDQAGTDHDHAGFVNFAGNLQAHHALLASYNKPKRRPGKKTGKKYKATSRKSEIMKMLDSDYEDSSSDDESSD